LMPRFLASQWCKLKAKGYRSAANRGYRAYTYSLPGYRKLFREAGFDSVKPYHAWDGYNKPSVLLPLEDKSALLHFLRRLGLDQSRKGRLKQAVLEKVIRCGLWPQVASEYVFLVEKG